MAIFTHVTVGTNDLAKARAFYDAVLAPLGIKRLKDFGDGGSCWGVDSEEFMVLKPADGKPVPFKPAAKAVYDKHLAAAAKGDKSYDGVSICLPFAINDPLSKLRLLKDNFSTVYAAGRGLPGSCDHAMLSVGVVRRICMQWRASATRRRSRSLSCGCWRATSARYLLSRKASLGRCHGACCSPS